MYTFAYKRLHSFNNKWLKRQNVLIYPFVFVYTFVFQDLYTIENLLNKSIIIFSFYGYMKEKRAIITIHKFPRLENWNRRQKYKLFSASGRTLRWFIGIFIWVLWKRLYPRFMDLFCQRMRLFSKTYYNRKWIARWIEKYNNGMKIYIIAFSLWHSQGATDWLWIGYIITHK